MRLRKTCLWQCGGRSTVAVQRRAGFKRAGYDGLVQYCGNQTSKRPKGGGMEIKFFDRIKALQCMEEMDSSTENGQAGFYRALQNGVRALEQEKHELENPNRED